MITTANKSNKILHKLKYVKYLKMKIFGSNQTEFCDFYTELYWINHVGKA